MIRAHVMYFSAPRIHAMLDDHGTLMHLYRVPGHRIESGAIVARCMTDGLLSHGFDGDVLRLDASSILRVLDYIDRTSRPGTSDKSKARRFRGLVESAGYRREMLAVLRRLSRDEIGTMTGEQAVFERYVLAQLWETHLRHSMIPVEEDAGERCAQSIEAMAHQLVN